MRLYVADWAPNGTNDLLIVDKGTCVCIQEATFGIDIEKGNGRATYVNGDRAFISPACTSLEGSYPEEYVPVKRITLDELRDKLACNPLDPSGERVRAQLKANGVTV